ncbi:hypothetical protein GTP81_01820 [Rugamonas sp. FT107W]|uniref:Uncharacterized protein n=1 Tax=Duganella vulcania TaxID=2692166 RepID=A0A845HDL3_9BURK|nr:hypothetical protein [Duganella vulcania]MYN15483.1 hypothetical protein [Duganella vulcania]
MRKIFSVVCQIIAGFFFYMVSIMAFTSGFPVWGKAAMMAGVSVPAFVALAIALALTGLRNWKRDTGVMLLSMSAFNGFGILTMACMWMSEEFRRMMPPDSFANFGAYFAGAVVLAAFAILGWVLFKSGGGTAEQGVA